MSKRVHPYIAAYLDASKKVRWAEAHRKKLVELGERAVGSYDLIDLRSANEAISGLKMPGGDRNILRSYVEARQIMDVVETAVNERMVSHQDIAADIFLHGMGTGAAAKKHSVSRQWIYSLKKRGIEAVNDEIMLRKAVGQTLSSVFQHSLS